MISFGFEDFCAGNGFDKCLEAGTAFRGLTATIGRMETFLLAETEAGTEAKAGAADAVETFGIVGTVAGTRGTETEAEAETGVALAVETFGTVGVVGTVGTEAKVTLAVGIVGIAGIAEIEAGTGTGVALGMEAFSSCARLNKNSR
jgi:hypothetical protein